MIENKYQNFYEEMLLLECKLNWKYFFLNLAENSDSIVYWFTQAKKSLAYFWEETHFPQVLCQEWHLV